MAETLSSSRKFWCETLLKMATPVLKNMSEGKLQQIMDVEVSPTWNRRNKAIAYMECFGRLMAGIAPWLSLADDDSEEGKSRSQLRDWALKSYKNAVDPQNPDYLVWKGHSQPMCDAAYIAESFLRGFDKLWIPLDEKTKQRYVECFTGLRVVNPPYNNWLLFSAIIETFLQKVNNSGDAYRISSALRKMEEWYVGDGFYADGPQFMFDYYNSFVMHPMYVECMGDLTENGKIESYADCKYSYAIARMQRYGIILERMISPEGTFPVVGRSMPYRTGCLQPLALLAWKEQLPKELTNGQVRAALTKVLANMFSDDRNFNTKGFLNIGFNGHQPDMADYYTNNGSCYIASSVFLPMGLPADHPFWTDADEDWTTKKAWNGMIIPRDHGYSDSDGTLLQVIAKRLKKRLTNKFFN